MLGLASARPNLHSRPPSRARLGVLDLERLELARDREAVVVEQKRARDAVLVEFERDRIDRYLLARLGGLLEIAHRHRPALHAGERLLALGGVVRRAFGGNLAAD